MKKFIIYCVLIFIYSSQIIYSQELIYIYEIEKPIYISLTGNDWEISYADDELLSHSSVLASDIVGYGIYEDVVYAESDDKYYVFLKDRVADKYNLNGQNISNRNNIRTIEFDDETLWSDFLSDKIGIVSL